MTWVGWLMLFWCILVGWIAWILIPERIREVKKQNEEYEKEQRKKQ